MKWVLQERSPIALYSWTRARLLKTAPKRTFSIRLGRIAPSNFCQRSCLTGHKRRGSLGKDALPHWQEVKESGVAGVQELQNKLMDRGCAHNLDAALPAPKTSCGEFR